MSMPGFTADRSLGWFAESYRGQRARYRVDDIVRPASCVGDCFQDCVADGGNKIGCRTMCAQECSRDPGGDVPPPSEPSAHPPLSSFPSPAKPPLGEWLGGPPNIWPCGYELLTHPVGYNTNRLAIGLLRQNLFITTREECYNIAENKQVIGMKVAEGLQNVNQVAAIVVFLASVNVGTLTRCVCDEFPW